MSLTAISGKVSKTVNGSNLTNALSKSISGNSSFLRNNERAHDTIVGGIAAVQETLADLSNALGVKNNMHVIGRYEEEKESDFLRRLVSPITTTYSRAVSYWGLGEDSQDGVIIDGYDNFRGDISVALPEIPVMYDTAITDQVVRNPNSVSMRVYVDLIHSDDVFQNIVQSLANNLGGLAGNILNAVTGETMNRAQKALNNLQRIQEYGKPFKVYTPHKVYENMMIEKISPVNDQKMNEILAADITFKEIVPTQSLGNGDKSTARKAPSAYANGFTKALGWTK